MSRNDQLQGRTRATVTAKLRDLVEIPGGRRTKFAVIAVWLVALFALGPLAGKFEDAQQNDPADYLPGKAESVKTIEGLHGFPSDGEADAITVFRRGRSVTAEDRASIERVRDAINERVRPAMNAVRRDSVAATRAGPLLCRLALGPC